MRRLVSRVRSLGNISAVPIDARLVIALALIAVFAMIILAALLTAGADIFDQLLMLIGGQLSFIVHFYFRRYQK